jgi:hypothetical protein
MILSREEQKEEWEMVYNYLRADNEWFKYFEPMSVARICHCQPASQLARS